jgi:hypothetical protein
VAENLQGRRPRRLATGRSGGVASKTQEPAWANRWTYATLAAHLLAGTLIVVLAYVSPPSLRSFGVLDFLVGVGEQLFGAVEHAFYCRERSVAQLSLVAVEIYTAHAYLFVRLVATLPVNDKAEFEALSGLDMARLIIMGLFTLGLYYYTFHAVGDRDATPGFILLCAHSLVTLWVMWTLQTIAVVVALGATVVPLIKIPIYFVSRLAAGRS